MSTSTVVRFPSLWEPQKYAYTIHADWGAVWDSAYRMGRDQFVSLFAGMYETYGDGLCQHSGLWAAGREHLTDYLASLAQHMLANPADRVVLAARWPEVPTSKTTMFLASLRYRKGLPSLDGERRKTQYYNLAERKVSTAPARQYDKRWAEVPSWADGSVEAVLRLYRGEDPALYGVLESYVLIDTIRDTLAEETGDYGTPPWRMLKLEGERHYDLNNVFAAVEHLARAEKAVQRAGSCFDCYLSNTKHKREPEPVEEVA